MYCTTCKPIVENQLKGNEAIKNIDIDYLHRLHDRFVVVEYEPTLISKEKIKERLENSLQILQSLQIEVTHSNTRCNISVYKLDETRFYAY
jgi:copper chaperone CopZ